MPSANLLARFASGPTLLRDSVAGMTREQLLACPIPGKWSTLEVVAHLADFEVVYTDRLTAVIAEEVPNLPGRDEQKYAARLAYQERDLEEELHSIELFGLAWGEFCGAYRQPTGYALAITPKPARSPLSNCLNGSGTTSNIMCALLRKSRGIGASCGLTRALANRQLYGRHTPHPYLGSAFFNLRQVVIELQPQPKPRRAAKRFRQTDGHLRRNAGFAVQYPRQGRALTATCRAVGDIQIQCRQANVPDDRARVQGVFMAMRNYLNDRSTYHYRLTREM